MNKQRSGNKVRIRYRYLNSLESTYILENAFDYIFINILKRQRKIREILTSPAYKKLYILLRKKKCALADFILYS
jgi:hypothetical protein